MSIIRERGVVLREAKDLHPPLPLRTCRPFAALRATFVVLASLCALQVAHGQAAAKPDGKKIFISTCSACHQATGEGVEGTYPPLAGSEWIADEAKMLRILLHGLSGPVEVAGETYAGAMPGWGAVLKDADIAAVATYVRSAWGNKAPAITTAKVTAIRAATKSRTTPWTVAELAQVIQVKK